MRLLILARNGERFQRTKLRAVDLLYARKLLRGALLCCYLLIGHVERRLYC
jgi:hypothetical protein